MGQVDNDIIRRLVPVGGNFRKKVEGQYGFRWEHGDRKNSCQTTGSCTSVIAIGYLGKNQSRKGLIVSQSAEGTTKSGCSASRLSREPYP